MTQNSIDVVKRAINCVFQDGCIAGLEMAAEVVRDLGRQLEERGTGLTTQDLIAALAQGLTEVAADKRKELDK